MLARKQPIDSPVRTRGRPKLEDVAAIENRLLAVALAEFTADGYGGTSMARIIKAAGVSKTTLYSRFSSKEDLFRAIIRHQIERLAASTRLRSNVGAPDLIAGLQSYANGALEFSLRGEMLEVNRLIYSESQRFPELGMAAAEATEMGIAQITRFIAQCAEADGLACRDPRAVAEAFIFLLRGWYAHNMLRNRSVSKSRREQWVARAVNTLVSARSDW
jgi:AcrR family transcriptional regulator